MAKFNILQRLTCLVLVWAFATASIQMPSAHAGEVTVPAMPSPGQMVNLSRPFIPAQLQGLTIQPTNALRFEVLINKGDANLSGIQKSEEYIKLVKYFLGSLTVAEKDQWVNLSPYEHNRIIDAHFAQTAMGRDLLAQDYLLKQITSSLMYPESALGKNFWSRVYERAFQETGSTNIPVNTFNKVWIVPDQADVYESGNTVYILNSRLKVMLEEDYVSLNRNLSSPNVSAGDLGARQMHSGTTQKVIRDIILPAIEKEVNEGGNFAALRQIYSAMILATWYKKNLRESLLGKVYADKAKLKGINEDPHANEAIYEQYMAAFKKGVYNYVKEEQDPHTGQVIPRKYFAGGFENKIPLRTFGIQDDIHPAQLAGLGDGSNIERAMIALSEEVDSRADSAMASKRQQVKAEDLPQLIKDLRQKLEGMHKLHKITGELFEFQGRIRDSGLANADEFKMFGYFFSEVNPILMPKGIVLERDQGDRPFLVYRIVKTTEYAGRGEDFQIHEGKLISGSLRKNEFFGEILTGMLLPYSVIHMDHEAAAAERIREEIQKRRPAPILVPSDLEFVSNGLLNNRLTLLRKNFSGADSIQEIRTSIRSYNTNFYLGQHFQRQKKTVLTLMRDENDTMRSQALDYLFALLHSEDPVYGLAYLMGLSVRVFNVLGTDLRRNVPWNVLTYLFETDDPRRVIDLLQKFVSSPVMGIPALNEEIRQRARKAYVLLSGVQPDMYFVKLPGKKYEREAAVRKAVETRFKNGSVWSSVLAFPLKLLAGFMQKASDLMFKRADTPAPSQPEEAILAPRAIPEETIADAQPAEDIVKEVMEKVKEILNDEFFMKGFIREIADDNYYQAIVQNLKYVINVPEAVNFKDSFFIGIIQMAMKDIDYLRNYSSFREFVRSVRSEMSGAQFSIIQPKDDSSESKEKWISYSLYSLSGGRFINSGRPKDDRELRNKIERFLKVYRDVEEKRSQLGVLSSYSQSVPGIYRIDLRNGWSVHFRFIPESRSLLIVGYGPKGVTHRGKDLMSPFADHLLRYSRQSVIEASGGVIQLGDIKLKSDAAMVGDELLKRDHVGGIDLDSSQLSLRIKRDGQGVPLPLVQQDINEMQRIQGFIPHILEIRPAAQLPIFSELHQKMRNAPTVMAMAQQ